MAPDARRHARYMTVMSKIMEIRIPLSGFSEEMRPYFEKYDNGEYVELKKIPAKELEGYWLKMVEENPLPPFADVVSETKAVVVIAGPEKAAIIEVGEKRVTVNEKKKRKFTKRMEKELGKEKVDKMGKNVQSIIKTLEGMGDSEESWEELYRLID